MCGIIVIVDRHAGAEALRQRLAGLAAVQQHRGPDGNGVFTEALEGGGAFGLAVQRLSIMDRSSAAGQPMLSADGRYVLAFNGELYNYRELALELGVDATGDTAVVMAALQRWGEQAFARFNGMWALAFYDRVDRKLLISRDRLGMKPLYVAHDETGLLLASEIKTILCHRPGPAVLNRNTVGRFLAQSMIDADRETFFEKIDVFPAASFAGLSLGSRSTALAPQRFWLHPFERPAEDLPPPNIDELRQTFLDAVRMHLRSDVPMGILLSGGVDSSAILAAAREAGMLQKITGISVVSGDPATSEERFVDLLAEDFGIACEKVRIDDDPLRLFDDIATAGWYLDQPIFSLAQAAHRRAFHQAREIGLPVLLSGQGGDEQLAGYRKYRFFHTAEMIREGKILRAASSLAASLIGGQLTGSFSWNEAKRYLGPWWNKGAGNLFGPALADTTFIDTGLGASFAEREWRDLTQLSLPMLLQSEDRMSMSWSCELRVPFLDHRLVELLGRMPAKAKLEGGWTKAAFRTAMAPFLPPAIIWRKGKDGYSIPAAKWGRGVLMPQFEALFTNPMRSAELGLIDQQELKRKYQRYVANDPRVGFKEIFGCASLELWLQRMGDAVTV